MYSWFHAEMRALRWEDCRTEFLYHAATGPVALVACLLAMKSVHGRFYVIPFQKGDR